MHAVVLHAARLRQQRAHWVWHHRGGHSHSKGRGVVTSTPLCIGFGITDRGGRSHSKRRGIIGVSARTRVGEEKSGRASNEGEELHDMHARLRQQRVLVTSIPLQMGLASPAGVANRTRSGEERSGCASGWPPALEAERRGAAVHRGGRPHSKRRGEERPCIGEGDELHDANVFGV